MGLSEIEAVYRRDSGKVSELGQEFYRCCRRQIAQACKRGQERVEVYGHFQQEVLEAVALLTHARNGFKAYWKVDPGPSGENDGRPYVVVLLKAPKGRQP